MKTLENIENLITDNFIEGKLNNSDMVQIIELCSLYLNIQTISDYAKTNGLSYNGVKKCRKIVSINKVKFVIDND